MDKICGIYKITSPTGKVYIGQSRDINKRFNSYKRLQCKRQPKLYNSFKKHGVINHKFEALYECNKELLDKWEKFYISQLESFGILGLNLTDGGHFGGKSKESKKKMSDFMKGNKIWLNRKHSEESKNKMRFSHNNIKFSKETRLKMSISAHNRIVSDETRLKQHLNKIGKTPSKEQIQKMLKTKMEKYGSSMNNMKNPSSTYEIYDHNNQLIYQFTENFIKKMKELKLPTYAMMVSHQNGTKIIRGQYRNWRCVKL
jgi:group I intron endonuclease